jgi:hypothetical protein
MMHFALEAVRCTVREGLRAEREVIEEKGSMMPCTAAGSIVYSNAEAKSLPLEKDPWGEYLRRDL